MAARLGMFGCPGDYESKAVGRDQGRPARSSALGLTNSSSVLRLGYRWKSSVKSQLAGSAVIAP